MMLNKFELPNRRPNERPMLILRRHWFILFLVIVETIIFTIIPIAFYAFLEFESFLLLDHPLTKPLIILGISIYYLFIWMFLFNQFIDYYLDVWIVTTERIINIEQKNLFNRIMSEKNLDRMQDITSEVKGIIPTFLNYGTVYIQTAGTTERFVFKEVPNAPEVTQQILKLIHSQRKLMGVNESLMPPSDETPLKPPRSL